MYRKLAVTNIGKNKLFYIPYIISGILVVAFVYMMSFMGNNKGLDNVYGADQIKIMMQLGLWIILIFAYIFLFYTNSFLIKRRKKEFGVYNMLGMEKRHIGRVLSIESLIIGVVSIVGGIVVGIAFSKLTMMLLLYILKIETSFAFSISLGALKFTVVAFGILYVLILLFNRVQIRRANTMELIKGGSVGEREPKTKVILSIIGFACLFIGYYISITVHNPFSAIVLFFVAVILVIIGTYIVFTTGSIFVLKLLKKNKKFYYNKRHMTAVSGMLYRMKQNAVGLANICILSTMVLVTISTTVSLYAGVEDSVNGAYSAEMEVFARAFSGSEVYKNDAALSYIEDEARNHNLTVTGSMVYESFKAFGDINEDSFVLLQEGIGDTSHGVLASFITREDSERVLGDFEGDIPQLSEDEVFIIYSGMEYDKENFDFLGQKYSVKGTGKYNFSNESGMFDIVDNSMYVIVPDDEALRHAYDVYVANNDGSIYSFNVEYLVECDGSSEDKLAFGRDMQMISDENLQLFAPYGSLSTMSREQGRIEYCYSFGGLFFLGIACGFMFLVVTVMIIFYKQISEGYDDRSRYDIMEKVGMSQIEVKNAITSQVRIVFFLPLIVSYCHLAGSFPMVRLMMSALFMSDAMVFVVSLLVTSIIFAMIYYLIFKMTSKTYYDIVK